MMRGMRRSIVMRRAADGARHVKPENAPGKFRRFKFRMDWDRHTYEKYPPSLAKRIKEMLNA